VTSLSLVQGSSTECVSNCVWSRNLNHQAPRLRLLRKKKKSIIQLIVTSLDIIFEKDKFNLPEFALLEGQSFLPGVPAQRRLDNVSARTLKMKEIFSDLQHVMSF
jgi:hypothetical protein